MFNPFKKKNNQSGNFATNMLAKIAMRKLARMSPREQQKMMQDAMRPENREKMIAVMESMKKSGQITEEQYNIAKKRLEL